MDQHNWHQEGGQQEPQSQPKPRIPSLPHSMPGMNRDRRSALLQSIKSQTKTIKIGTVILSVIVIVLNLVFFLILNDKLNENKEILSQNKTAIETVQSRTRKISGIAESLETIVRATNAGGEQPQPEYSSPTPVTSRDYVRGSRNAEIFLIEYSDIECPVCQAFHPIVQSVINANGGKVAWVYRHFPLDGIHPNARSAAEASECVGDLGGNNAFWRFVDLLFEEGTQLSRDTYIARATQVGVNQSQFIQCFDSGKFADKVEGDLQSGIAAGVNGTPGSFLVKQDGSGWIPIPGLAEQENLQGAIDQLLAN